MCVAVLPLLLPFSFYRSLYLMATAKISNALIHSLREHQNQNNFLRVCPREDQADVTHAISPISLKLSQMIKVIKLFKSPE